jgi:hypothetical protein
MIPMAIPLADIIYRSYYDEQEYHLRMQQLAGFANRVGAVDQAPSPGRRLASLGGRLRTAASTAITAAMSLPAVSVENTN